jgi:homoserine dehydrogenase
MADPTRECRSLKAVIAHIQRADAENPRFDQRFVNRFRYERKGRVTTSRSCRIPVVLSGYGVVGAAYAEQLCSRADKLEQRHGVRLGLSAIQASTTECLVENGPVNSVVPPRTQWRPVRPLDELLAETGAVVFAQAIPSSPELADRAAQDALIALRRGVHVVTATKSHLLTHWSTLGAAADAAGCRIRISGATGAALPAGDLARVSLRGFGCRTIRACLNGTSTFVLDGLAAGTTLPEALAQAQRRGIAEADPSADLSGTDAATKVRLCSPGCCGTGTSRRHRSISPPLPRPPKTRLAT